MKKILALLLAGCMALALCACGTPAEPADETGSGGDANASANGDTVVIGVFEPLSGDNGAGGKQEVLGMQYANAETPAAWRRLSRALRWRASRPNTSRRRPFTSCLPGTWAPR